LYLATFYRSAIVQYRYCNLLGPFGNPFFHNNDNYNKWIPTPPHPTTKQRNPYQLNRIFISKNQLCHTSNVKRKIDAIFPETLKTKAKNVHYNAKILKHLCYSLFNSQVQVYHAIQNQLGETPTAQVVNYVISSMVNHKVQSRVTTDNTKVFLPKPFNTLC